VEIQRPGKVLFPGRDGTPESTKGDLARPGAPVAVHLAWKQVDDPEPGARRWTLADAVEQARTGPWAGLPRRGRSLGPARRRLDDMCS
jgi:bifunctional non-homologous end joining protein LigD